ncbi:MAG: phosphoribosylanthranilate isomerase [Kofleriaceae bacterium]
MTRIKICGVTEPANAAEVVATGIDYLGLNFWPRSKRYLAPDRAPAVADAARAAGKALLVGVFVDATVDEIAAVLATLELDLLQLHGDEAPDALVALSARFRVPLWKVVSGTDPGDLARWPAEAILLDTPSPARGGTGQTFDWNLAHATRTRDPERAIVLAGGLDPENVGDAITIVRPFAVDVASGVERAPGLKDLQRVAAFVAAVRAADQSR